MEIKTLKTAEHRGCRIYIRNFANVFEYLTIIKGEVFSANIVVTRSLLQRLSFRPYTPKQLASATSYVLKMAETTVDYVLDSKQK